MTRRLFQIVLVGAIALGASSASALMQRETSSSEDGRRHDFTGVGLRGDLQRPPNSYVSVPARTKFGSHIQLRAHFNPELERSVSSL